MILAKLSVQQINKFVWYMYLTRKIFINLKLSNIKNKLRHTVSLSNYTDKTNEPTHTCTTVNSTSSFT